MELERELGALRLEDHVGAEKADDDEPKEVEQAGEGNFTHGGFEEVAVDAEFGHGFDGTIGAGSADFVDNGFPAEDGKNAAEGHRDNKGDDLIPGEGRDKGGNGEEGETDEETAEVAGEDGFGVRFSEVDDGPDHGEGQGEGEGPNDGGGEELSPDGTAEFDGKGAEELDGVGGVLVGPLAHADGRNQDHEEEGVEAEEGAVQAGISDIPKSTKGEGEESGEKAKDDDDGIRSRLGEVAGELAFKDGPSIHADGKLKVRRLEFRRWSLCGRGHRASLRLLW